MNVVPHLEEPFWMIGALNTILFNHNKDALRNRKYAFNNVESTGEMRFQ